MKPKLTLLIALTCFITAAHAQTDHAWDKWAWLTGEWIGEGSGDPGKGSGSFSLLPGLDGKVLIRKNHSEYPATKNQLRTVHDDLMIVYLDYAGEANKAIYFDNEGHTINYVITYTDSTIVLLSEKMEHVPTFKLIYTLVDKNTVNIKFEISNDGKKFITYLSGNSRRKKE